MPRSRGYDLELPDGRLCRVIASRCHERDVTIRRDGHEWKFRSQRWLWNLHRHNQIVRDIPPLIAAVAYDEDGAAIRRAYVVPYPSGPKTLILHCGPRAGRRGWTAAAQVVA